MLFPKIKRYYHVVVRFLTHDIWHFDTIAFGRGTALGVRYLKILLITIRSMSAHKVGLQAAALTFFTMIAIIPFVALVYAITKGFGFTKELESIIYANFSGQEEIVQRILEFANNLLDTSKSGLFGIIGSATFLWSIIWVMISVEQAINNVWQVKNSSSFGRKVLIYTGLIIFSPALIGASFLIPLSYNTFLQSIGLHFKFLTSLEPIVGWLMLFLFLGGLIFAAYKLIPNTKIETMPALYAAIITTIASMAMQALYLETQIFVSRLNAIYGAFAAIPFFMFWMQMNWFLILLGAELSFAFQNIDCYKHYGTKTTL